jgi:hypothetical protein
MTTKAAERIRTAREAIGRADALIGAAIAELENHLRLVRRRIRSLNRARIRKAKPA